MLNLNKHTKINLNLKPTFNFKNCSYVCAYHCAQLSYTTQHRAVLIISLLSARQFIIAQVMSTGGTETLVSVVWRRLSWLPISFWAHVNASCLKEAPNTTVVSLDREREIRQIDMITAMYGRSVHSSNQSRCRLHR